MLAAVPGQMAVAGGSQQHRQGHGVGHAMHQKPTSTSWHQQQESRQARTLNSSSLGRTLNTSSLGRTLNTSSLGRTLNTSSLGRRCCVPSSAPPPPPHPGVWLSNVAPGTAANHLTAAASNQLMGRPVGGGAQQLMRAGWGGVQQPTSLCELLKPSSNGKL
jgi:hypothetical protein